MNVNDMVVDGECLDLVRREISRDFSLRFNVLLVDDSETDRFFLQLALADSRCLKIIGEARDGLEAADYLSGAGQFSDRALHPFPHLLLLDFDMPHRDGAATLEWIRQQHFADLTVVMFSGSLEELQLHLLTQLGCDFVQVKTARTDELQNFVRRLELLMVCRRKCLRLPTRDQSAARAP